jgi:5'-deoxynucleotidase YfbR-like HD superfamily hydrolase
MDLACSIASKSPSSLDAFSSLKMLEHMHGSDMTDPQQSVAHSSWQQALLSQSIAAECSTYLTAPTCVLPPLCWPARSLS